MPYLDIGTGDDLIVQIPTDRTKNWGTNFRNNFALKIAEHDHSGSGRGRPISTAGIANNSITGAKILLANDEYLRGRNNADSADVNIIKVDTADKINIGTDIANIAMINNNYLLARNNADSAYINMIKVNASDKLELGADVNNLAMINNTYIQGRNNADSAYVDLMKVNTSDKINIGAELANLQIINNIAIQARNNADSAYIDLIKLNTSDEALITPDLLLSGNITKNGVNTILGKSATIANTQTGTNITDAVLEETEGKSYEFHYSIYINATTKLLEKGVVNFTFVNGSWQQDREYSRDDSLVTFSVSSGQIQYDSATYAGFTSGLIIFNITKL